MTKIRSIGQMLIVVVLLTFAIAGCFDDTVGGLVPGVLVWMLAIFTIVEGVAYWRSAPRRNPPQEGCHRQHR